MVKTKTSEIILKGELSSYGSLHEWVIVVAGKDFRASDNQHYGYRNKHATGFYVCKRNAKRGAERWVKKNLPGAVIEWES